MKTKLLLCIFLLLPFVAYAASCDEGPEEEEGEEIIFNTEAIDPTYDPDKLHKSPMRPPVVYILDNTLTFAADHPEYNLIIKDENGDEVYQTIVPSAEVQVVLPTFLSGDYQIELIMGIWKFSGYISI